jgi:hypothetical protein
MGLHDRDWYQKEIEKKGGRPMTFDQKAAASIAKKTAKPTTVYTLHPSNRLKHQPKKQWSPVILAIVTIIVLALLTISLVSLLGKH